MAMNQASRRRIPAHLRIDTWHARDGWPLRCFGASGRPSDSGSVLFLGGRGDFFEKYLEAIDRWTRDGWNVAGFDWRGQGGSGRAHPAGLCHVEDFALLVDDLAAYGAAWRTATPGPHIAVGHSMGAHVLLRAAAETLAAFDGIVLLSPMIGLRTGPLRGRAFNRLAALGSLRLIRDRPIWTGAASPMPGRITSCAERHADKLWWKAQCPDLARGAPTWGWLAAAVRSMAILGRTLGDRSLITPGLILSAAQDPIIDVGAIRGIRGLLPNFDYATIDGAGHELLREADGPRQDCMSRIGDFLDRCAASAIAVAR